MRNVGRTWGIAWLGLRGTALTTLGPQEGYEGVVLAGQDALAGAAGGRQAVLHTGHAALAGSLHLVHHGEAGLDG